MIRNTNNLISELTHTIEKFDTSKIAKERLSALKILIDFIQDKKDAGDLVNLNFVCTHNSRRSHLTQIWAQALSSYYNIPNVTCYSGGTEATALFPKIVETLSKSGFEITKLSSEVNPVYSIKYAEQVHPVIGFSKGRPIRSTLIGVNNTAPYTEFELIPPLPLLAETGGVL